VIYSPGRRHISIWGVAALNFLEIDMTTEIETGGPAKPEQEPLHHAAPDLLQELISLRRAYIYLLNDGCEKIIALGGQCDDLETMVAGSRYLRDAATAIARATGEES
jgi:hypothetical protein